MHRSQASKLGASLPCKVLVVKCCRMWGNAYSTSPMDRACPNTATCLERILLIKLHTLPVAGSTYSGTVSFDVSKYSSGASADSAATISVTIPREFRGKSEVLVFLSPEPVQGTVLAFYFIIYLFIFGLIVPNRKHFSQISCLSVSSGTSLAGLAQITPLH